MGLYKATITDDRGQDVSQIDVSGKGNISVLSNTEKVNTPECSQKHAVNSLSSTAFDDIINELTRISGTYAVRSALHTKPVFHC